MKVAVKSMIKPVNKTHLEDATLRDLIQGLELYSLPDVQRQHFDTCTECQNRMESLAADSWWWSAYRPVGDDAGDVSNQSEAASVTQELGTAPSEFCENQPAAKVLSSPPMRRLEQYRIESLIGSGGMGVVYKAHDTHLNRAVAIKMLLPHLANQPGVRKQFLREARSAAAISHEHVIDIFEVKANARHPFLVMSWVPGETLEEVVARTGAFSPEEVVRYALQIASALAEAHRLGVVHRDIKPSNILLDVDQQKVVITDFGLAKTIEEASLTRTGLIAGTPHYMSPEQCQGKQFCCKSDLFSLGGVMYFLATGLTPFKAQHPLAVMNQICHRPVDDIRRLNRKIDNALAATIHRLLEIDPADRFASAQELTKVLESMLAHFEHPDAHPMPKISPPKSWRHDFFRMPSWIEGAIMATGFACIAAKVTMALFL